MDNLTKCALTTCAMSVLLAGCNTQLGLSDAEKHCEDDIISGLRSPSSYERIRATSYYESPEASSWEVRRNGFPETPHVVVFIEYDADNAFGATLRGSDACYYVPSAENSGEADLGATLIATVTAVDELARAREGNGDETSNAMLRDVSASTPPTTRRIIEAYAIDFYAERDEATKAGQ